MRFAYRRRSPEVRREQLEHVLRAACSIAESDVALVVGSQAILGSFPDDALPPAAARSIEVDIAFFDDPGELRSDLVDGAIGELSTFHETFGYYAQGVGVGTAVLPEGWRDRLVRFATPASAPGSALCLEPHDLVASKLVAYREKDLEFAAALIQAGLVDPAVLHERIDALPIDERLRRVLHDSVSAVRR
jgi:hypothetical protein